MQNQEHVFLLAANFKSDGMTSHEQYRPWLPSTVQNGVLPVSISEAETSETEKAQVPHTPKIVFHLIKSTSFLDDFSENLPRREP